MKQAKAWILGVLLAVMLAGTALADYQKGLDAFAVKNYAAALAEFTPLAEAGHTDAQLQLGLMYKNGIGVPQDYKEAVKWYRLAAEAGNSAALFNVGKMYNDGKGVPQDEAEAVKWFLRASEKGHAFAQSYLGFSYALGKGVEQDLVRGYMWLNLSTAQGLEVVKDSRDKVANLMSSAQISEAQDMSRKCFAQNYKGC